MDDKAGVLSKVTSVLSKHGISVARVIQEKQNKGSSVSLILITHCTHEKNTDEAVQEINKNGGFAKVVSVIRVV